MDLRCRVCDEAVVRAQHPEVTPIEDVYCVDGYGPIHFRCVEDPALRVGLEADWMGATT